MTSISFESNSGTTTLQGVTRIEFGKRKARVFYEGGENPFECTFHALTSSYFGTKRASKLRKPKDPNRPKRPKNAYMLYCIDVREKVKQELNTTRVSDVQKRLGELWKELSTSDKQPYVDKSKSLSDEYQEAMKTYTPTTIEEEVAKPTETSVENADQDQVDSHPQAPDGWTGPVKGALLGAAKDSNGKIVKKKFKTFQEAVMFAEGLPKENVGGITVSEGNYAVRVGTKIKKTNGTDAKGEVSWLLSK
jgi:hypothetical protein